jgi:nucleotide-binding universal stress UspA family protein
MFEPKQILVPTDFSPSAWTALQDAAAIADAYGAWLDILYVWDIPTFAVPGEMSGYGLPNSIVDAISAQAHRRMENFLGEARSKGIPIRNAQVLPGNAPRVIIEAAKSGDYDLIVLGSRHLTGLKRAVLGSVAERVVRHAPCPVLLATAKAAPATPLSAAQSG